MNVSKRFTTQMYVYFLPKDTAGAAKTDITASTDGGIEHVTLRFATATEWLRLARTGQVIMFPPQVYLLHLLAPLLDHGTHTDLEADERAARMFVTSGIPLWSGMCICPVAIQDADFEGVKDGRVVLSLAHAGPEMGDRGSGDAERVVLVDMSSRTGPSRLEIVERTSVKGRQPSNL